MADLLDIGWGRNEKLRFKLSRNRRNGRIRVALADQVEMRLLPKLRGVDVDDYAGQFGQLQNFVQSELNDTKLSDAIERSVEISQQNRQFTWTGVTR